MGGARRGGVRAVSLGLPVVRLARLDTPYVGYLGGYVVGEGGWEFRIWG